MSLEIGVRGDATTPAAVAIEPVELWMWQIATAIASAASCGAGAAVALRVHTHVREDVIALYGFASELEQQLFERLIGISGIGPKLALAVLSGIDPGDLVRAIRMQDVARLTRIPGVGKKTAERIGLELKDRLPEAATPPGADAAPGADDLKADLLSALTNLGYNRAVAEKALESAVKKSPQAGFEQLLRDILRHMIR